MSRSALVDLLKAAASLLIVLHHLAIYAPMADRIAQAWPALVEAIAQHGRLAVQSFLVMGGFLAAQALHRRSRHPVHALVWQRYVRLAVPLACALLLVLAATVLVGRDLAHAPWVSPLPGLSGLLAHLLLLQDILGIPSILAGAWYVAVDLQLFALFVLLVAAAGRWPRPVRDAVVPAVLALATAAGILVFGRDPDLDAWALYFLPAYGLGALAAWSAWSRPARRWWLAVVALLLADWLVDPRVRPLVALATALALQACAHRVWPARPGLAGRAIRRLSDWSYGVFVSHYPVILLASGLWHRLDLAGLPAALLACAAVVAASIVLGALVLRVSDRLVAGLVPGPRVTASG